MLSAPDGQDGQVARAFHRARQLTLVPGAVARDAGAQDPAALGEEGAEDLDLLVVDHGDLLGAEAADLAARLERAAAAGTAGGRARGPASGVRRAGGR